MRRRDLNARPAGNEPAELTKLLHGAIDRYYCRLRSGGTRARNPSLARKGVGSRAVLFRSRNAKGPLEAGLSELRGQHSEIIEEARLCASICTLSSGQRQGVV